MNTITMTTSLRCGLPVNVEFTYVPARPGRMYLSNGDPGYPPEESEVDLVSVTHEVKGESFDMLADLGGRAMTDLCEKAEAHALAMAEAHLEARADDMDLLEDVA
jgi:hypothetical protein